MESGRAYMGAKRSARKRLIRSLLGGVLIPVCYSIVIVPVLLLLHRSDPDHFARDLRWALVPIYFPVLLGDFSGILPADNFVGNISLFIIFGTDLLVYALLTYCILWLRSGSATHNEAANK
jgi:hypothetical protein